ncbi:unnamed protein product [Mytilus edulis]|uniref:Uncharacterized protein n=1 Tax=Mytilus edulis TaxID=6550 RepID=A0A8S3S5I5_MYTED|nr:unnamed protein product [Mytilus edulis]
MIDLYHIGLTVETSTGQQKIYVIVSTMTMNLQARAGVFNMTQHNGLYSCIFCEEPGLVVKVGKGHTRCFPYREEKPKCRSSISIEQNVLSAIEAKKPVYGFFGRSIIKHLPFIDFHESCTVDYMHGFLLGITKKLLSLWIAGSSYQKPYFIGHNLKDIDKILTADFSQIPRKIEFRSFLLFYALPCLKDFLPGNYLEHFACLIEATFLLLQEKITPRDIKRAELLLDTFYKCSKPLYGDAICGLNVHNISHIIKLVEDWGPLWTFSCFSLKSIHGKGNVSGEVYWAVHSEKIIENEVKQLTDGKVKQLLQNILRHNRISSNDNYEIGDQCYVMKPLVKVLNIEESLKEQISDLLNTTVDHLQTLSFFKAAKIRRNNFVFYSQSCGKVKQRNSYTVLLHKEYKACDIVQIQYFLQIKEKRKTFAVGNGFMRVAKVLHGRGPSIQKIDLRRQNLVIQTSLLEEHVVYMEVNKQQIVGRFPNFVEKD